MVLSGTINHRQNKSNTKSMGRLGTVWLGNHFPSSLWVCISLLIVQIAHRTQAALHPWPPMLTYPSPAKGLRRDDVRPACSSNFAPNPAAEMSPQRAVLAGRRGFLAGSYPGCWIVLMEMQLGYSSNAWVLEGLLFFFPLHDFFFLNSLTN